MKKIILLLFVIFLGRSVVNAQAGNWAWAQQGSTTSNGPQEGWGVATDHLGNVYATGIYFTNITLGTVTLSNGGNVDMYLAKYNSTGNLVWARKGGGTQFTSGNAVATDNNNNVYVTGYFQCPTIVFGSTTLTNLGTTNMYIVKYDTNGNIVWAKGAGGTSDDRANAVSTDTFGNIYVTGYFSSPSITFGSTTLTNTGNRDIFTVKYDNNGNVLWAKSTTGSYIEQGNSISTDASGNAFVTGFFGSTNLTVGTYTLTNTATRNIFIIKYDTNGNVLWAKSAGGSSYAIGNGIATDVAGNIYITGYFMTAAITFGTTTFTNYGHNDMFITKYDTNGNVLWAKNGYGTLDETGYAIATYNTGLYVTVGFLSPTTTIGSNTLSYPTGGLDPVAIVNYDLNGTIICYDVLSSGGDDICAIATDSLDNAYIAGDFEGTSFTIGGNTFTGSSGGETVFTAKYNCKKYVGINETENQTEITIAPNPTSGSFQLTTNVSTSSTTRQQLTNIKIFNVLGETVSSVTPLLSSRRGAGGEVFTIDLSNQPKGIYFVQLITNDQQTITKKLILTNNN